MAELDRDEDFEDESLSENQDDIDPTIDDFFNIVVSPADWTIQSLFDQIGQQIDVNPEFQRRGVWNKKAKSSFIESLFLNIPIPQILLASSKLKKNSYIVLDGKQRLLTIKEFMDGRFDDNRPFKLRGLRILTELEGKSWEQIKKIEEWPDLLRNHTQRTAVLKGWSEEGTLYEIFHRLNSGSVQLSPMELRMALLPGEFLKYAIQKTETTSSLHRLLKLKKPDRRMADVELLVRHLAFKEQTLVYRGNLKQFLDDLCMEYNLNFDDDDFRDAIERRYQEMLLAIDSAMQVFGVNACRKRKEGFFEQRFNRAVFDIQIGALSNHNVREAAANDAERFQRLFIELSDTDPRFIESMETTTKSIGATRYRFSSWYGKLNDELGLELETPNIADI